MKKETRLVLLIGIIALTLLIIGFLCFPRHFEAIATRDDIKFGMTPFEVRLRCGNPNNIEKSTVSPTITYTYYGDYNGNPSVYYFTFIQDQLFYRLSDASIHINDSSTNASTTYNSIINICKEVYQSDSMSQKSDDETITQIQVNHGATCLFCTIEMKQTSIVIRISRIW